MSRSSHKIKLQFIGCDSTDGYRAAVDKLILSMDNKDGAYTSSFTLVVRKKDGEVSTKTKELVNLTDEELKMVDALETLAQSISKGGKEPNKVRTQVEVQKEI